jgi:hypothetical protein
LLGHPKGKMTEAFLFYRNSLSEVFGSQENSHVISGFKVWGIM